MGRREDLERHIRQSYDIVRQYEEIVQTSSRPEEKARARHEMDEQWGLIQGYLAEYRTLCQRLGRPLAEDVVEIAATLEAGSQAGAGSTGFPTQAAEGPIQARGCPLGAGQPAPPPGPIQNRWALLVGVDRYVDPAIPSLRFCVNDVLALETALEGLGYTVVALHDQTPQEHLLPTRDNVEAELARLTQVAGPDDLLLVHLACHGKLVNGQAVLITREVRAPTLAEKALPLAEVERRMRESQARRLVLILDACHTGVEIGRDLADPEFMRNAYDLAEGFALLAASTAQQVAQEWGAQQHGVFTYYLLEGLSGQADRQGKRFVTVDDLKTHVLNGLRRWNVEHGGLLQEPTARTAGLGDMILADYRAATPPPSPPESPAPPSPR